MLYVYYIYMFAFLFLQSNAQLWAQLRLSDYILQVEASHDKNQREIDAQAITRSFVPYILTDIE